MYKHDNIKVFNGINPSESNKPYHGFYWWNPNYNKKVLLRERKRHTAHHVASTPSAVLSGGGTQFLARGRGYDILT